jgi:hypothetical protein
VVWRQLGDYTITVTVKGFENMIRSGIRLEVVQTARIDFVLRLGAATQTLQVVANASPMNQENSELKTGISPETLQELPFFVLSDGDHYDEKTFF